MAIVRSGSVALPVYHCTARRRRGLGEKWPRNVLRHSFISCRIAIVKSADQVALEAGNSAAIIFKHYREPTTEGRGHRVVPDPAQGGPVGERV